MPRTAPRSLPAPRRPGAKDVPNRSRAIRAWAILGAGALVFLLLLWGLTKLLSGGGDEAPSPSLEVAGPTGVDAVPFAPLPPEGSVTAAFPAATDGNRLELKVLALGDDPDVCHAEALVIEGDERSVYHHGCAHAEDIDRAFFLVRLTNTTDQRVSVALDRFVVVGADGERHDTLPVPPVGVSGTRFFPQTATLGPGASLKRWVTIDGSDGERPARLTYQDGPETLMVRFEGRWA
jgi:hypothetical protein